MKKNILTFGKSNLKRFNFLFKFDKFCIKRYSTEESYKKNLRINQMALIDLGIDPYFKKLWDNRFDTGNLDVEKAENYAINQLKKYKDNKMSYISFVMQTTRVYLFHKIKSKDIIDISIKLVENAEEDEIESLPFVFFLSRFIDYSYNIKLDKNEFSNKFLQKSEKIFLEKGILLSVLELSKMISYKHIFKEKLSSQFISYFESAILKELELKDQERIWKKKEIDIVISQLFTEFSMNFKTKFLDILAQLINDDTFQLKEISDFIYKMHSNVNDYKDIALKAIISNFYKKINNYLFRVISREDKINQYIIYDFFNKTIYYKNSLHDGKKFLFALIVEKFLGGKSELTVFNVAFIAKNLSNNQKYINKKIIAKLDNFILDNLKSFNTFRTMKNILIYFQNKPNGELLNEFFRNSIIKDILLSSNKLLQEKNEVKSFLSLTAFLLKENSSNFFKHFTKVIIEQLNSDLENNQNYFQDSVIYMPGEIENKNI